MNRRDPYWVRPPIEIIRSAQERPESRIVIAEKPDLNYKQMLKRLVMTSVNKKHPNGRIYSTDKDGNYVSHTVSPYSKIFEKNLEDGIRPLILALARGGYLPISSCASHELTDRRFVALCFTSEMEANDFVEMTRNIKQSTGRLKHMVVKKYKAEEYLNTSVDIDKKGNIKDVSKQQIEKQLVNDYLQILFMRTSEDWWLLEVEIMPNLPKHTWWGMFKRWWYKKFSLEKDTKVLMENV